MATISLSAPRTAPFPARYRAALACFLLSLAACGGGSSGGSNASGAGSSAPNPYAMHASTAYAGTANWLCHPDLDGADNVCNGDLRSILVEADGSAAIDEAVAATDPPIDCFYVYPTASIDPGPNSDFEPGMQETQVTLLQAGRYRQVCRVFAPSYRSSTLTLLALDTLADPAISDEMRAQAREVAYADVLDAFSEYMARHNRGRGVVLVGHSQGSTLLARLIAEEIERHPYLMDKLVAAHLPGANLAIPVGRDVGGSFKRTPACRASSQTACVIGYASYRKGDPELSDPVFGVTADPGTRALCVNPSELSGDRALEIHVPFVLPPVFQLLLIPRGSGGPYANRVSNLTAGVPFYSVPGQISAACVVNEAGVSYLEVSIAADPADPRADDYPGEFFGGTGWGLHLADLSLAQGNLVRLAALQGEAWRRNR